MPVIFLAIIALYLGGNVYIFIRGAQALSSWPATIRIVLAIAFCIAALLLFAGFMLRSPKIPGSIVRLTHIIGTSWMAIVLYMSLLLIVFDLLRTVHLLPFNSFFPAVIVTVGLLIGGYIHYRHPSTREITLHIDKPLTIAKPLRIVAISDIHLGYGTGKKQLAGYVNKINSLHPDIVVIGGDLIDRDIRPVFEQKMEEELNKIEAPMGIFMVPGNHDYYAGIDATKTFVAQTNITLLRDSTVTLPCGLTLVGRDDRTNPHRRTLQQLTAQTDSRKAIILLDHQPYALEEDERFGIDLQFSGHTHHGQMWPLSLVTDAIFEQSSGYRHWGKTAVYVSSGLSLWGPPFRIGTSSELVLFNIISDKHLR